MDDFFKRAVESCLQSQPCVKFWSLTLRLYRPQVARATAQISEITEWKSRGKAVSSRRLCGAGCVCWGMRALGGGVRGGYRATLRFVFKPREVQNVDSRSNLSSHRIPGLEKSCKCYENSYQV